MFILFDCNKFISVPNKITPFAHASTYRNDSTLFRI